MKRKVPRKVLYGQIAALERELAELRGEPPAPNAGAGSRAESWRDPSFDPDDGPQSWEEEIEGQLEHLHVDLALVMQHLGLARPECRMETPATP